MKTMTYNLTRGYEIETCGVGITVAKSKLRDSGIKGWKAVVDGSNGVDVEFVSCPMADSYAETESLRQICDFIESIGATVNRGCGLHIHIGNALLNESVTPDQYTRTSIAYFDRTDGGIHTDHGEPFDAAIVKDVALRYTRSASQPNGVNSMLSQSRRDYGNGNYNQWARMTSVAALEAANTIDELEAATEMNRTAYQRKYSAINFKTWSKGTVEFRQHQGTIDAEKILNWSEFLTNLFQHSLANRFSTGSRTTVTSTPERAPFRAGGRIIDQYNLMRQAGGCTTRDIMMLTGCSEGSARRGATEIRDRLERDGFPRSAVIQHDQISNGHRYGDGTDLNGYEIALEVTVTGSGPTLLPDNAIGNASIWAGISDDQYSWWQDRIVALA